MKISVIVPAYNEEPVIEKSVESLTANLKAISKKWELIIVNDGSTDNTESILTELAKKDNRIRVFSYKPNRGRGKALRTGFEHATGDLIVTIESDSSWGPDIIRRLVDVLKNNTGIDVAIASPHLRKGSYKNVPLLRKLLASIGNKILCLGSPNNLTMITGMTRAYKSEVIKSLNLISDGKEIHLEIISKIRALGCKIKEIPATITWKRKRKKQVKKRSTFKTKKLIISHLLFTFYETPSLLLGTIGLLLTLIGFLIGIYILYLWISINYSISGREPLIIFSVMLILTGIQILLFTLLANQNKETQRQLIRLEANIKKK